MDKYLDLLPMFVDSIREIRELIISNIVLIGQISAPTFHEKRRAESLVERLAEFQMDECAIDDYGNPMGIIRGTSPTKPPIFIATSCPYTISPPSNSGGEYKSIPTSSRRVLLGT